MELCACQNYSQSGEGGRCGPLVEDTMATRLLWMLGAALVMGCQPQNEIKAFTPELVYFPEQVEFDDLVLGEDATTRLQLGNAGLADLEVESVSVSEPFALSWTEGVLDRDGGSAVIELGFLPEQEADLTGIITIESNDPDNPVVEVPITAAPRAPVIAANPGELLWPDAALGGEQRLDVDNLGEGPLRITSVSVAIDAGGVFSLPLNTLASRLDPSESGFLDLLAEPSVQAEGLLRITSNDPVTPELDIPLTIGALVEACPEATDYPAETVPLDDTCFFEGLDPVWDPVVEVEWRTFTDLPDYPALLQALVGRVTDDNGDGIVDELDPPDICTIGLKGSGLARSSSGIVRLLDPVGVREHWTVDAFTVGGVDWEPAIGSCALADVDADGDPEVVVPAKRPYTEDMGVAVLDRTGTLEWLTPVNFPASARGEKWRWMVAPAVADLEGDGVPEIIVGHTILDGSTGIVRGEATSLPIGHSELYTNGGPSPTAADLDGDGIMEVVAGSALLDPDGNTLCEASARDGYPAVADLDGDGDGEVVLSGSAEVAIYDHNCQMVATWATPDGGNGGAPTLADYDGDGIVEIGIASKYWYYVFESDGSVLWQMPVIDASSNSTGSSVFDFDGDGSAEVVYADEQNLYVFDGATGRTRFVWTGHSSGTSTEEPVIADVDDDGSAEIITCQGFLGGCTIVGSQSSGWMPARPLWNQFAFSMTHVNDDLSIPTDTSPNWPELNTFRSADVVGQSDAFDRNARPALVDVCNLDCDEGMQRVVAHVQNPGVTELPLGIELALVAVNGGVETELVRATIEDPIGPGETSRGVVFDVPTADMSDRTLLLVVDPDDRVTECDELDNTVAVVAELCPEE